MHLIPSRGLALITGTHGGTLPVRRHLLPVHYDSLTLAMCCLFLCACVCVCEGEGEAWKQKARLREGLFRNTRRE